VVRRLAQNAAELTFGIAKSALLERGESTLEKIGRRRHCVRDFGSSQRRRQIEAGYSGRPGPRRGQGLVSLRTSNTGSRAAIPKRNPETENKNPRRFPAGDFCFRYRSP
jgi:hypothetical protein